LEESGRQVATGQFCPIAPLSDPSLSAVFPLLWPDPTVFDIGKRKIRLFFFYADPPRIYIGLVYSLKRYSSFAPHPSKFVRLQLLFFSLSFFEVLLNEFHLSLGFDFFFRFCKPIQPFYFLIVR